MSSILFSTSSILFWAESREIKGNIQIHILYSVFCFLFEGRYCTVVWLLCRFKTIVGRIFWSSSIFKSEFYHVAKIYQPGILQAQLSSSFDQYIHPRGCQQAGPSDPLQNVSNVSNVRFNVMKKKKIHPVIMEICKLHGCI